MSNYTKATNFATKDTLPSGDAGKIVKGTEIDNEFNAIASAITSKANTASPTFTGTPAAPTATSGSNTTQIATTAFVTGAVTTATGSLGTISTQDSDAVNITGGTIVGITDLAVADGGTGASTAADARSNLGLGTLATQSAITSALLPTGVITQVQYSQYTSTGSFSSGSWQDTGITVNITPSSSSNKVLVRACVSWSATDTTPVLFRLVRSGTTIGAGSSGSSVSVGMDSFVRSSIFNANFEYLDSPSTTSSTTYKVQGYSPSGSWTINENNHTSGTLEGYYSTSSITVQEVIG